MTANEQSMIFAYGSNMHLADLNRWLQEQGGGVVGQFGVKVGRLLNYRLAWNYYSVSRGGGGSQCRLCSKRPGLGCPLTKRPGLY